jgi:hypothetical protein
VEADADAAQQLSATTDGPRESDARTLPRFDFG